jgi:SAM-dependent methyltransferase
MGDQFYDQAAEYMALFIPYSWKAVGPALDAALEGVDIEQGPIVDVGAGTGSGTALLARMFPHTDIIAIEPHPASRTALMSRVAEDDDLARRVTIVDTDFQSAALPDRISAVIGMNLLGHLDTATRDTLWQVLAKTLAPNGRAVFNIFPPTHPQVVAETPVGTVTIGRRQYSGSIAAKPHGDDAITWHMTYRVEQDGTTVKELTASYPWYVFTPEQLASELAGHGFHVTAGDPPHGLQIVTK